MVRAGNRASCWLDTKQWDRRTPPWRIRLKASRRSNCADQTTRIYTQKYVKIRQNGCAYYFQGIKLCRLIAKINTRFQTNAPRRLYVPSAGSLLIRISSVSLFETVKVNWLRICSNDESSERRLVKLFSAALIEARFSYSVSVLFWMSLYPIVPM